MNSDFCLVCSNWLIWTGKMREKKGVVTGELPPSHHHDGHHLWCFCFLWGFFLCRERRKGW
uniref:Uncharacterized protein n=1 Tax=Helianthus annuus TaxID=4232 RepID=A0A251SH88_HELAN